MPIDRIEIYPGCTIDVSRRHIKGAGLHPSAKVLMYKMSESERNAVFGRISRDDCPITKYSTLLLDEAVFLSKSVGEKKACEMTGVGYWSLKGRKRTLIRQGKYHTTHGNPGHPRYTLAQKQKCVALAMELMADPTTTERPHGVHKLRKMGVMIKSRKWTRGRAFVEAGRRLGMNGRSVLYMYAQGMIPG